MLKKSEKARKKKGEKKERKQDQGAEAIWKKMRFTWRSHSRTSFVFV